MWRGDEPNASEPLKMNKNYFMENWEPKTNRPKSALRAMLYLNLQFFRQARQQ